MNNNEETSLLKKLLAIQRRRLQAEHFLMIDRERINSTQAKRERGHNYVFRQTGSFKPSDKSKVR